MVTVTSAGILQIDRSLEMSALMSNRNVVVQDALHVITQNDISQSWRLCYILCIKKEVELSWQVSIHIVLIGLAPQ